MAHVYIGAYDGHTLTSYGCDITAHASETVGAITCNTTVGTQLLTANVGVFQLVVQ